MSPLVCTGLGPGLGSDVGPGLDPGVGPGVSRRWVAGSIIVIFFGLDKGPHLSSVRL